MRCAPEVLHGISHDAWKRYSAEGSWYYEVTVPGFKYNLTDLQAALGLHQFSRLEAMLQQRLALADLYHFTGVRPGEKLREELAFNHEVKCQTAHPRIYRLQERDAPIDHDTLLGVCTLLAQTLNSGERRLREEIFRIASHDVDGFLTAVVGFDLMRHRRRLSAPVAIRTDEEQALHISEQAYAPA